MLSNSKGSEWRKWDLHFHTPSSYDYEDKSVTNELIVEVLRENNISVVVISDHHIIDIERIQTLQSLGSDFLTVFPGIEFKAEMRGREPIHFIGIFSEYSDLEFIWGEIQSKAEIASQQANGKNDNEIYCDLQDTCELIKNLGGIISIHAGSKSNSIEVITNSLPVTMAQKRDIVENVHIFEIGNTSNIDDYVKSVFPEIGTYPMVICSDNHDIKNYILKENCWIKADPTFEGLKQIVYEPLDRVKIQGNKPISPVRKIINVHLGFKNNTKISLRGGEESDFCFSGLDTNLYLNDYFNCFIGGRGTGKSTILNFIYKIMQRNAETDYFKKNIISVDGEEIKVDETIGIVSTAETVEFLEQNQIENFAIDQNSFTKAIYSRLKSRNQKIEELDEKLQSSFQIVDEQMQKYIQLENLIQEISHLEKSLSATSKIIDTIETEEYQKITSNIKIKNIEYLHLKNERERVESLNHSIRTFLENYPKINIEESSSKYIHHYNEFIDAVTSLSESLLDSSNFTSEAQNEDALVNNIKEIQSELELYLSKQGLQEENLQDVKNASVKADEYSHLIRQKKDDLGNLKIEIAAFDLSEISNIKTLYDAEVEKTISQLKEVLDEVNKNNPDDIDKINLAFSFNNELAYETLFEDFLELFEEFSEDFNFKRRDVKSCLFEISPHSILEGESTRNDLRSNFLGNTQYQNFLDNIFKSDSNFRVYKLLIIKHFLNSSRFLKIDVSYRDKPIEQASFGQKCTSVIVIMLLFGHNPIIIDEPEAHLDSSLIANYLVELIKKQKIKRQIIFATHNANFVINADSEQIFILEMPDKQTVFTQTTIEDLNHRESLLKLEGGKRAFFKRENKYGFN